MKPSDLLQYVVSGLIVALILILLGTQLIGQPAVVFVETGSMAPTLEPNDGYLSVPKLFAGEIGVGDVILFKSQEIGGGELTTHRVTEITDEGYITKGDANPFTDQAGGEPPVSDGQVRSVALQIGGNIVAIPGLGASVGAVRSAQQLFQETVLLPLGIDAEVTTLSTGALIAGLLLFVYGTVTSATDRYERSRSRSGLLANAVVVIAILTLVVIIPVNFSMLLPSGVYQYEILSSESPNANPQVIGVGESSDVTYAMRNSGFIPTLVFLEPASGGVTLTETQIYVPQRSTVETSITMQAPDETGSYLRFVREYRYLVVLPPSFLAALHAIHPAVAILAVNFVVGGIIAAVSVTTVGTDRLRLRSRNRELELGDEIRRRLPGVLLGTGGPKPPAPEKSGPQPPPKPSATAETAATPAERPQPSGDSASDSLPGVEPSSSTASPQSASTESEAALRDSLTDEERVELNTTLSEAPEAAGLDAETWSVPLVQRYLFETYTVDCARDRCGELLQRAGHDPDASYLPADDVSEPAGDATEDAAQPPGDEPREYLTDAERVSVRDTLSEPPTETGLDADRWTLPLLQRYLFETYFVDYPPELCVQLLQQAGHDVDASQQSTGESTASTTESVAEGSGNADATDSDVAADENENNDRDGWEAIDPEQIEEQAGDDWENVDSGTDDDGDNWEDIDEDNIEENTDHDWGDADKEGSGNDAEDDWGAIDTEQIKQHAEDDWEDTGADADDDVDDKEDIDTENIKQNIDMSSESDESGSEDLSSDIGNMQGADDSTATGVGTQAAAMNQFTQVLDEHLGMLCEWYVASHTDLPSNPPTSYQALFSGDFAETVRQLDFSTNYDAESSRSTTWLSWSAIQLNEFRNETMAISDEHSDSIDSAVTEQLRALVNSRLTKHVITADEADIPTDSALLLFSEADGYDPLATHLDMLNDILVLHGTQISASVTPIHERDCWDADHGPQPGVANADPDTDNEQSYELF